MAILTDHEGLALTAGLISGDAPAVLVLDNPRAAVGIAAAEIYGRPGDDLLLLGVTGTNGKTTTTWMLEHALRIWGHTTGLIGTVETQIAGEVVESVRTTPEAPELHALLAVMRERSVTAVAVEVSSHAMTMGRVDGCVFDAVGFTQFGVDHLDFHGTEANYFEAKRACLIESTAGWRWSARTAKGGAVARSDSDPNRGASRTRSCRSNGQHIQNRGAADWRVTSLDERAGDTTFRRPPRTARQVHFAHSRVFQHWQCTA